MHLVADEHKITLAALHMDHDPVKRSCTLCVHRASWQAFHYNKRTLLNFWKKPKVTAHIAQCPFSNGCGSPHRVNKWNALMGPFYDDPDYFEPDYIEYYNRRLAHNE